MGEPMSDKKLSVLVCECGKQYEPKEKVWAAFHRHGDDLKPYEEVEVIPVDSMLAHGGSLIEVSEPFLSELDRKWSRPVEVAIKDGELIFRNVDLDGLKREATRWRNTADETLAEHDAFKERLTSPEAVDAAATRLESDDWFKGEFPESAMEDAIRLAIKAAEEQV